MKLRFSWRVNIVCGLLSVGMLSMAFWQWQRHQSKLIYIENLSRNLDQEIINFENLDVASTLPEKILFRRVHIKGQYDFQNEITLRNRKINDQPGTFVITPLKIDNSDKRILVSRGFVPLSLSSKDKRVQFQKESNLDAVGIIKESSTRRLFAPKDPDSGAPHPWVDTWLRVDIANIAKQLPYDLYPFYIELMDESDSKKAQKLIVKSDSEREEMLFLSNKKIANSHFNSEDLNKFPLPSFSTVVPPGRHLGYVYEWSAMAIVTWLIALILQMRRPSLDFTK